MDSTQSELEELSIYRKHLRMAIDTRLDAMTESELQSLLARLIAQGYQA